MQKKKKKCILLFNNRVYFQSSNQLYREEIKKRKFEKKIKGKTLSFISSVI